MTFSSQHHSFDVALCCKYGMEAAVMIHHFQHWIRINKFKNVNQINGRTWSYQSREDIQSHFPYWSYEEVKYLCEKLRDLGVLMTANYNKNPKNRTLWYAFVDEKEFGVDDESVQNYYRNSNNFYEKGKVPNALGKSPQCIYDKDTIIEDSLDKSKESSLKRAKEKSATPPPLVESPYRGKFEDKIKMTPEQHEKLCKEFGVEKVDKAAEEFYEWGLENPTKFKHRQRHDITIKKWIKRSLEKEKSQSFDKDLNEIQKENWRLNQEIVNELKAERPDRASGLNWFYKTRILKDKNNNSFDLFGLMNHKDFCMQLERHLKIKILHVRFAGE